MDLSDQEMVSPSKILRYSQIPQRLMDPSWKF